MMSLGMAETALVAKIEMFVKVLNLQDIAAKWMRGKISSEKVQLTHLNSCTINVLEKAKQNKHIYCKPLFLVFAEEQRKDQILGIHLN